MLRSHNLTCIQHAKPRQVGAVAENACGGSGGAGVAGVEKMVLRSRSEGSLASAETRPSWPRARSGDNVGLVLVSRDASESTDGAEARDVSRKDANTSVVGGAQGLR